MKPNFLKIQLSPSIDGDGGVVFCYNDFIRSEKFKFRSLLSQFSIELWSVQISTPCSPKDLPKFGYKSWLKEWKEGRTLKQMNLSHDSRRRGIEGHEGRGSCISSV